MKTYPKYNLKVFQTAEALHQAAAEFIIETGAKAIGERGRFTLSLSGGNTPQKLYALLAQPEYSEQIDWKNTFVFWGDERCVPLDDERNNAHQAMTLLLSKVAIPLSHIHRIPVNLSAAEAATKYERELHDFFGEETPHFDIMLLGLGENGHTASLFPHTKVLDEKLAGIRAINVEEQKAFRVTMNAPLINLSRHIIFLVEGKNKADVLEKVLTGTYQPQQYPAQLIQATTGDLHWYVDSAAASLVKPRYL